MSLEEPKPGTIKQELQTEIKQKNIDDKTDNTDGSRQKLMINVVTWNINKGTVHTSNEKGSKRETKGSQDELKTENEDEPITDSEDETTTDDEGSRDVGKDIKKGSKAEASVKRPTKGTTGFGEARNLFTQVFADTHPSMLYCIQEPQVKQPKGLPNFAHTYNNKKDGAIASPDQIKHAENVFSLTKYDPPQDQPVDHEHGTRSKNEANAQGGITWPGYDDEKRFYCRKITIKDQRGNPLYLFMLVSYHAKYKGRSVENLKQFFEEMCKMANEHRMPVIVGGDFNIDVKQWREEVVSDKVKIPEDYSLGPRRQGKDTIDTIAIVDPDQPNPTTPTKCEIIRISGVEFEPLSSKHKGEHEMGIKMSDLEGIHKKRLETWKEKQTKGQSDAKKTLKQPPTAEELFHLMDHDPVIAEIELSQQ